MKILKSPTSKASPPTTGAPSPIVSNPRSNSDAQAELPAGKNETEPSPELAVLEQFEREEREHQGPPKTLNGEERVQKHLETKEQDEEGRSNNDDAQAELPAGKNQTEPSPELAVLEQFERKKREHQGAPKTLEHQGAPKTMNGEERVHQKDLETKEQDEEGRSNLAVASWLTEMGLD